MSLGEVLDTGWKLYVENLLLFVSFSLVVAIPGGLLMLWLSESAVSAGETTSALLSLLAVMVVYLVISPLASAATTRAVAGRYLGESVSFRGAWSYALSLLLPLLGAMLLAGLLIVGGMILLIIPGLYLMLRFAFLSQAVVVERLGGSRALKRSGALMKGNYGTLIALYFLSFVFSFAIGFLMAMLPIENVYVLQILASTVQAVAGAFVASAVTVSYFERRCRHEGFDLERLADNLGLESPVQA
jgi:hypothetical protein